MKALGILICLAGSGALWAWAVLAPKPIEPLDDRYCGTFELYRYEAAPGQLGEDPVPAKQRWIFEFEPDHLYRYRILFRDGAEMLRREGVVHTEVTPEGTEFLVLTQSNLNGVSVPAKPDRFLAEWGSDELGAYLHLTVQTENRRGEQWFLRRQADAEATRPGPAR